MLCAGASAHDLRHPKHELLRVSRDALELVVDSEVAAGPGALALRQSFDRNRDGALDPAEQEALREHLVSTALLRTRLKVDGAGVTLTRASLRTDKLDLSARSDAMLSIRVVLRAPWPAGTGDWRGRRRVELFDEDASGHVPVEVSCEQCAIAEASSGVYDPTEKVRGAQTPLILEIRR